MEWIIGEIVDYFKDFLKLFGIDWNKEAKLLFLGLDNAGKTTLLYLLKTGHLRQFSPTFQPNSEQVQIGKVSCTCHDLGGHELGRVIWDNYFPSVSAIIFIIDASDRIRIDEAKLELSRVLTNPSLSDVPILILGNKFDLDVAFSEVELRKVLQLEEFTTKNASMSELSKYKIRPIELFMSSLICKQGYQEGFKWLSKYL